MSEVTPCVRIEIGVGVLMPYSWTVVAPGFRATGQALTLRLAERKIARMLKMARPTLEVAA